MQIWLRKKDIGEKKPAIPLDLCSVLAFHMCSFCCRRVLIALLCITILVQIRRRSEKKEEIGPR